MAKDQGFGRKSEEERQLQKALKEKEEIDLKKPEKGNIKVFHDFSNLRDPELLETKNAIGQIFDPKPTSTDVQLQPLTLEKAKEFFKLDGEPPNITYKDAKGQPKSYDGGNELKELGNKLFEAQKALANQYGSNYYSYTDQKSIKSTFENAISLLSNFSQQKLSGKPQTYQSALQTAQESLDKVNAFSEKLKKTPTIKYSTTALMKGETPTKDEIKRAVSKAILEQRHITGVEFGDPEFKKKITQIDAEDLGKIEVAFESKSGSKVYEIQPEKFLKKLQKIDVTKDTIKGVDKQSYSSLQTLERDAARNEINVNEKDLKTLLTKHRSAKTKSTKSKAVRDTPSKKSKLQQIKVITSKLHIDPEVKPKSPEPSSTSHELQKPQEHVSLKPDLKRSQTLLPPITRPKAVDVSASVQHSSRPPQKPPPLPSLPPLPPLPNIPNIPRELASEISILSQGLRSKHPPIRGNMRGPVRNQGNRLIPRNAPPATEKEVIADVQEVMKSNTKQHSAESKKEKAPVRYGGPRTRKQQYK